MTTHKTFKRRVRARMEKTGERYTAARARLVARSALSESDADAIVATSPEAAAIGGEDATRETIAPVEYPVAEEAVLRATGRGWDDWLAILDGWGARERRHPDIARWLRHEQGVHPWWAQSVTVGYERARGMRAKHELSTGYTATVTRTIDVSADRLLAAVTDPELRERWLPGAPLRQRATRAALAARFDWSEPPSVLVVGVVPKGPDRAVIAIGHERLPDADSATRLKAWWRERLADLKREVDPAEEGQRRPRARGRRTG